MRVVGGRPALGQIAAVGHRDGLRMMRRTTLASILALMCLQATAFGAASDASLPGPAWQREVVYQVYPRSFADSDGDGAGDLRGITQHADYLHDLGVNMVWLNPIYKSTHFDGGYDVSDYTAIDPAYGTLDDWYALRDALHARGMRIMMDMVLNHSSDGHPWFIQEKRLKALQHGLATLITQASPADGEAIINVIADPSDVLEDASDAVRAAARLVNAYASQDDNEATRLGYPNRVVQMTSLAEALEPCARDHHRCQDVARPFEDFYIWRETPNNWTSLFSGSAWHAVPGTGGHYLAIFSEHQADLNWRNPSLRHAVENIIATWEKRGADGFRLDSAETLSKNPTFPDGANTADGTGRGKMFFANLPEVHRYLHELAHVIKPDIRTIGEAAFVGREAPVAYAGLKRGELNEVFLFGQMAVDCNGTKWRRKPFSVQAFKQVIDTQQATIHGRAWLGNFVENHDNMRIVSRYGDAEHHRVASAKVFATLLMTLEGTPYIYQGQEIGMTDLPAGTFQKVEDIDDIEARNYYTTHVKAGENADVVFHQVATRNRDHVRSAMQWDATTFAGFSTHTPKVRLNGNHTSINVQASQQDPQSVMHFYQRMIQKRRAYDSWVHGAYVDLLPEDPAIFAYTRTTAAEKSTVLLNMSSSDQDVTLPASALVAHPSDTIDNYPGDVAPLAAKVHLRPWESRVVVGAP